MLKKATYYALIIFFTGFFVGYVLPKLLSNDIFNEVSHETLNTNTGRIFLPGEDICLGEDREICLQKINDRLRFMNDITAMSHFIETKSGKTIATINFPAFSDRTKEEKEKIIQKIKQSNIQVFSIGIASRMDVSYIQELKTILPKLQFNELHIQLYSEPKNIIELFDTITWKENSNIKITVEFIHADLPDTINLFNYVYMTQKMIKRNNRNTSVDSLTFIFHPLFGEFQDLYRYILYPWEGGVFDTLSTKNLSIYGISRNNEMGSDYEDQKGRVFDFLTKNPIQNIFIDSIATKKNGVINLYGF